MKKKKGRDSLRLEPTTRTVFVGESAHRLTLKEFQLLAFLIKISPSPATREKIYRRIWKLPLPTDEDEIEKRCRLKTVSVHVGRIRKKLTGPRWLVTDSKGKGYAVMEKPRDSKSADKTLPGEAGEIFDFLDKHVLQPVLRSPQASRKLKAGVLRTRNHLLQRTTGGMRDYFWRNVRGTVRSIPFAQALKVGGFKSFDDFVAEFREKFDDKWYYGKIFSHERR